MAAGTLAAPTGNAFTEYRPLSYRDLTGETATRRADRARRAEQGRKAYRRRHGAGRGDRIGEAVRRVR